MRAVSLLLLLGLLCCARGGAPTRGLGQARSAGSARVALVMGNGAYQRSAPLRNPPADARALAEKLRSLGFETELSLDEGRLGMERALREFGKRMGGAEVALLFYAGHGLQVGGRNYLVPIDARLESEADVPYEAIDLQRVLEPMQTRAKIGIIFLDACRDNPLANRLSRSVRSVGRGLERMEPDNGELLIAYATSPGRTAADGKGAHSPFAQALLQHLGTPGVEVQGVLRRVIRDVEAQTGGQQIPWQNSSIRSEVFLGQRTGREAVAGTPVTPAALPTPATPAPDVPRGMVLIPAGTFQMDYARHTRSEIDRHDHAGLPAARAVTLPSFFLDRTEVSVADYLECQRQGACGTGGFDASRPETHSEASQRYCNAYHGRRDHPMNCVRFGDAAAYCAWAHKRLPTAEEWEYAAYGADGRRYPWGPGALGRRDACWQRRLLPISPEDRPPVADEGTCEVGGHPLDQGPFGALDLGGNVQEWTATRSGCCRTRPLNADFAACATSAIEYVVRGGFWGQGPLENDPGATWGHERPEDWAAVVGFRCARDR